MFTGLVEEVGKVKSITKSLKSANIEIKASMIFNDVKIGDSISVNGVCLTVTKFLKNSFFVDIMAETMRRSNLDLLKVGDEVNLERALKLEDRLGGHIVSGHIDGMGTIMKFSHEENAVWCTIVASKEILKYIINKGSITIDGVSLTVAFINDEYFMVSIIPHTKQVTILLRKKIGDKVNLECDMIGKYIEKLFLYNEDLPKKTNIDHDFLSKNGFL